jgi:hypothetical protein
MRKFLIRWWLTSNYSQDRFQQAIVEWNEKRDHAWEIEKRGEGCYVIHDPRDLRRRFVTL